MDPPAEPSDTKPLTDEERRRQRKERSKELIAQYLDETYFNRQKSMKSKLKQIEKERAASKEKPADTQP